MSKGQLFKLHPLSRALKIFSVAPLLLFCDLGYARVLVPGEVLAIDANTKQDNYVLNGASTLNANGALTRQIVVNNSTLNMQGSTVQATGATGVLLNAGRADISANTHITSDRNGLAVSRNATATQGSTAIVSDSFINGGTSGATITGLSNLTLLRTEVTGAKAMGLNIFGGTITATDSTITGNASGIEINSDPLVNAPATLTLNHSKVEGRNGPAILIDTLEVGPVQANISVLNGTTLTAGNGTLMDVRNGAEGNLRVGSSTLVGDNPLMLTFSGQMLRDRGNGPRYATYRVRDRAGNESLPSANVRLQVNIQPPPLRKHPTVKEAQNGPGTGVLDPRLYGVSGVTVVIPKQEDEDKEFKREVFWKGNGEEGSHHALLPNPSNKSEFLIPAKAIPPNIGAGRIVEIIYTVDTAGSRPEPSDPLKLTVKPIAVQDFNPPIDCPLAARGTPLKLKLASVPDDGTPLVLQPWVYQAQTQLINIWLWAYVTVCAGNRASVTHELRVILNGCASVVCPIAVKSERFHAPRSTGSALTGLVDTVHSAWMTLPVKDR